MNGSQTQSTTACVLSHTHHKRRASMAGPQCPSMQTALLWTVACKTRGLVEVSVSDDGAAMARLTCARLTCVHECPSMQTALLWTVACKTRGLVEVSVSDDGAAMARLTCARLTCVHGLLHDLVSLKKDLPGETGRQGKAVSM